MKKTLFWVWLVLTLTVVKFNICNDNFHIHYNGLLMSPDFHKANK